VAATRSAAAAALGPDEYAREYATGAAYSLDDARKALEDQALRR
jgi:hypothetical protein